MIARKPPSPLAHDAEVPSAKHIAPSVTDQPKKSPEMTREEAFAEGEALSEMWNAFNEKYGFIADEYKIF